MNRHVAKSIYFAIQKCRRERVNEYLVELEKSQYFSKERLENIQLSRLKYLVNYANKNVRFYRNIFLEKGISVDDFQSLNDFKNFPIISKSILIFYIIL